MAQEIHTEQQTARPHETRRSTGFVNHWVNPFVRIVLRSPFHRLLSGDTMLITVRGRKTGREYTTPVNYVREGDTLTVVSHTDRSWWRNLGEGARVYVRVRGRKLIGWAAVEPIGGYELIPAYLAFREKLGRPVPEGKAAEVARELVLIKVELN